MFELINNIELEDCANLNFEQLPHYNKCEFLYYHFLSPALNLEIDAQLFPRSHNCIVKTQTALIAVRIVRTMIEVMLKH